MVKVSPPPLAVLANLQKLRKCVWDTPGRTWKTWIVFSFISKKWQIRCLYMRYPWRTLHDTMTQIFFHVGTLKYVPSWERDSKSSPTCFVVLSNTFFSRGDVWGTSLSNYMDVSFSSESPKKFASVGPTRDTLYVRLWKTRRIYHRKEVFSPLQYSYLKEKTARFSFLWIIPEGRIYL